MSLSSDSRRPAAEALLGEHPSAQHIRSRAARHWLVTAVSMLSIQGLQLVTLVVMARLLAPADFGVLAMVTSVIGIVAIFGDLGLAAATVRLPWITHGQVNTLFWINAGFSCLIALISLLASPAVAAFYSDPRLTSVAAALSVNFLVSGLGIQHQALLRRNLRFADLARIRIGSVVLGSLVGVGLALQGAHYWALAGSSLVSSLIGSLMAWRICPWRPTRPAFDPHSREMISFGGYLLIFGFLRFLGTNLQNVLIGRTWGAASVGLYNRAYTLHGMLIGYVLEPLSLITPASLSGLADNPEEFRRHYLVTVRVMILATAAISGAGFLLSNDVVHVLLGQKWAASGDTMRLLALALVPQALCHSTGWLYVSRGKSRAMMVWGLQGWSVLIAGTVVGLQWGPTGVATGYAVAMFVQLWPCLAQACRGTTITLSDLWVETWRPTLAAGMAVALVLIARERLPLNNEFLRLGFWGAAFAMGYAMFLTWPMRQGRLLLDAFNRLAGAFRRRPSTPGP
jgi:PST family polysaccharide transporter